jgi:hypothetical protein
LSSPGWDGEVPSFLHLGGMGNEKVSNCPLRGGIPACLLLGGMGDEELSCLLVLS